MKRKNIFLSLGSMAAIVSPIVAVVSCGQETKTTTTTNGSVVLELPSTITPNENAENNLNLDNILTTSTKEEVLKEMTKFFNGEYASVTLGATQYELDSYATNFELQLQLQSYVYQLSQKYPTIIISTPYGQKTFSQDKIIDVKSLVNLPNATFENNIYTEGANKSIILGEHFPKAPAHSWFEFTVPELLPEVPSDVMNAELDRELHRSATAWDVITGSGEHAKAVGQFFTPSEFNKEFTINVELKTEDGYVPNAFFKKSFKFKTTEQTDINILKEGVAKKYFSDKIFSLTETVAETRLLPIKQLINKTIKDLVDSERYSFEARTGLPNLQGYKDMLLAQLHDPESQLHQEATVYGDFYISYVEDYINALTGLNGVNDLANKLDGMFGSQGFNTILNEHAQEYHGTGIHALTGTPEELAADPLHLGVSNLSEAVALVNRATTLNDLKTITDKLTSLVGSAMDYNQYITTIDGVTNYAELEEMVDNITNVDDLKDLFVPILGKAALPGLIQAKMVRLIPVTE